MDKKIERFYDKFSSNFVRDIAHGNTRVRRSCEFLKKVIVPEAQSVLVVGCGAGQQACFISNKIAKRARVLAVDISAENIKIANKINKRKNIEYQKCDVVSDDIEGVWDYILFPDVYEHIPKESRKDVHLKIKKIASNKCRVIFTVPSPYHQAMLRKSGQDLQIVDEDVFLKDFVRIADDIGGVLVYFNMVSIWNTNDYIYAVIEKDAGEATQLSIEHRMPYKGYVRNYKREIIRPILSKLRCWDIYRKIKTNMLLKRIDSR